MIFAYVIKNKAQRTTPLIRHDAQLLLKSTDYSYLYLHRISLLCCGVSLFRRNLYRKGQGSGDAIRRCNHLWSIILIMSLFALSTDDVSSDCR